MLIVQMLADLALLGASARVLLGAARRGQQRTSPTGAAAGRTPPHLWHGAASNEEVRRIVGEHLDRLGQHLSVALAENQDDKVRAALTEVERGILAHRRALSDL